VGLAARGQCDEAEDDRDQRARRRDDRDTALFEVILVKMADRSVLGCMNDMAYLCENTITGSGGLRRTDLAALNRSLQRNIDSACGCQPPIELTAGGLGIERQGEKRPKTSAPGRCTGLLVSWPTCQGFRARPQ
jgi:hypothetical protein